MQGFAQKFLFARRTSRDLNLIVACGVTPELPFVPTGFERNGSTGKFIQHWNSNCKRHFSRQLSMIRSHNYTLNRFERRNLTSEKPQDTFITKEWLLQKITTEYKFLIFQHGFSEYAIIQMLKKMGFVSQMAHVMITPLDIVEYIIEESNKKLSLHFQKPEINQLFKRMPIKQRIKSLLQFRMESIQDYVKANRWHEGMALWLVHGSETSWHRNYGNATFSETEWTKAIKHLLPEFFHAVPGGENLSRALWHLVVISDEIVFLAMQEEVKSEVERHERENSLYDSDITSPTWYTDRASVAFLYLSTELFMLTDVSEEFRDTWNFIDRSVDRLQILQDLVGIVKYVTFTHIPNSIPFLPTIPLTPFLPYIPIIPNLPSVQDLDVSHSSSYIQGILKSISTPTPRYPRFHDTQDRNM